jgi:hypothetical protein
MDCRFFPRTIQQPEVVDHAVITNSSKFDSILVQFATVSFIFVAQVVAFRDLNSHDGGVTVQEADL